MTFIQIIKDSRKMISKYMLITLCLFDLCRIESQHSHFDHVENSDYQTMEEMHWIL